MTRLAPSDPAHESLPSALPLSLLLLRIGVTIVMGFWTIDKLLNPDHAGKVFKGFYGIDAVGEQSLAVIAIVQGLIVLAFALGAFKTASYGAVLIMHAISTLASWKQYLDPFENLLFLAAWPMLAACVALFLLRDFDRLLSVGSKPVKMSTTSQSSQLPS